jgi:hypothetical protein
LDTRLSAFRFLAFFFRTTWPKAQIVRIPAATAGVLWRRSVRRAEKFSSRDDDSGANRIARTIPYVVIAGLDPAIHGAAQGSLMDVVAFGASAWTTGASPVVTKRRR